jgi:hypothetical protein
MMVVGWNPGRAIPEASALALRCCWVSRSRTRREVMIKLVAVVVSLGVAVAFTAPAFAADVAKAKTEADCTKAGGVWDATAKKCKPKM